MISNLRLIARRLKGPSSSLAFGVIEQTSVRLISATKSNLNDSANPKLMSVDDAAQSNAIGGNNNGSTGATVESSIPGNISGASGSGNFGGPVTFVHETMGESTIIDINIDDMMYEDNEFRGTFGSTQDTNVFSPVDGAPVAPIDIDCWADEETDLDGTTEAEKVEKQRAEFHYPPIPKDREGIYEFKGIKIELPKSLMRDSTYRYRLTPEERAKLPDDTRIIVFDPPENKSESDEI